MSWTIEQIVTALAGNFDALEDAKSVSLPIFDSEQGIGIGVDGHGSVCLVLPGLPNQSAFESRALSFDPWCDTTWLEKDEELPKCAVLRCRINRDDQQQLRLLSGILLSLVDLQLRFNDAGHAIWTLKDLFGEGFNVSVPMSVIRGLIGELLVIDATSDTNAAIARWHVDTDDRYDFSFNNLRIEVKTTTSTVRQHRFTSRQLPPLHGVEVWVASVQLAEVSVGESLGTLFDRLAAKADQNARRKLLDLVVETLGVPPAAVLEPHFDRNASLAGIRLFEGEHVPTALAAPGTSDIKWTAYLDESSGISREKLNQIMIDGGTA